MGHVRSQAVYDKTANRAGILAEISEEVERNGDARAPYNESHMTWHESPVYADREAAERAIEGFDKGFYDDHAVLFHDCDDAKPTAAVERLEERIWAERQKKLAYIDAHRVKSRKSESITCPKCGSRIMLAFYREVREPEFYKGSCPVCNADMRPKSTLERIDAYDARIAELKERLAEEKRKGCEKAPVKWLVKFEYHV